MTAEVAIQAGICGFQTKATATSADEQMVTMKFVSGCEKITELVK